MSIPRVAHFTTHKAKLPDDEQFVVDEFVRLHPNWKVKIWSDEMNERLFREHLPDHAEMILKLPFGVIRADLARYLYLKSEGGWYLDTDYQVFKPLDEFSDCELVLPISWGADDPTNDYRGIDKVCNSIMGSRAGHPFWDVVIAEAIRRIESGPVSINTIEEISGPDLLTQTRASHLNLVEDSVSPEQRLFHPRITSYPVPPSEFKDSFGAHWCKGAWRRLDFIGHLLWRIAYIQKRGRVRNWMKSKFPDNS
ncbi:glycosyltransferase [Kamptonema cortianum]|nr:glycosyltransferase [Geitlerinema splendidum]MDK3156886.1 glycosyltransferase [Kamptonema cortianum]